MTVITKATANRSAPHTALLRTIEDYMVLRGAYTLRIMAGLGQRRGSPDLICCLAGRLVAIDAKTGNAKMTGEQVNHQVSINYARGIFIEARSVDDVENTLISLGLVSTPLLWPRSSGQGRLKA